MPITILYEYKVTEHYDDKESCPEDFGFVQLDHLAKVGEIIQLKWLDGRNAYKLLVDWIDGERSVIHGHAIKE